MSIYSKAIAAAVIAALTTALTAWQAVSGDGMTGQDWVTVALAVLSVVAVYFAPANTPQ